MYNNELYHYGVKGMKWGVRKKRETTGPRTNWGKDRAYAKEQDKANIEMWKSAKSTYKTEKKAAKRAKNKSALKAAKSKYKAERTRYNDYNNMRNTYIDSYGMTKAARGKQMKKLGISADKPISDLKTSKVVKENAKAMAKQMGKYAIAQAAVVGGMYAGAKYLEKRANMKIDMGQIPRLGEGNTIYLNPRQYKVH